MLDVIIILGLIILVSAASYILLEAKLVKIRLDKKSVCASVAILLSACIVISGFALYIYTSAGIVRDVPELEISKDSKSRGMHAEYNERIYDYDVPFTSNDKIKIAIYGNSFARDWAYVLLESSLADKIEISYIILSSDEKYLSERYSRFDDADYIFYCIFTNTFDDFTVKDTFMARYADSGKLYLVGNKAFGENNGIIYNRRHKSDYALSSYTLPTEFIEQNDRLNGQYGSHYIDMISPAQYSAGVVRVFDDNTRFLSQDCLHLTHAGASFYASVLDLSFIEISEAPVTDATQE